MKKYREWYEVDREGQRTAAQPAPRPAAELDKAPLREARPHGGKVREYIKWSKSRDVFEEVKCRQAKVNAELEPDRALCRSASPTAWRWARMFAHPDLFPDPSIFASDDKKLGWRLSRRGYDRPPDWLLRERPTLAGLSGR